MTLAATPASLARATVEGAIDAASSAAAAAASAASARAKRLHLIDLYSKEYWWSIGGFLGVLAVLHVAGLVSAWIIKSSAKGEPSDVEKGTRVPSRSSSSIVRAWHATTSLANIVLYRLPIPLRRLHNLGNVAEVLCVLSYIGATVAWALMNSGDVRTVTNWSSRAGLIAANQIPFIVALGGKNNVISFFTGLSHEKLNVVHRAAGRTIFVISWTHFGAKMWSWLNVYHENAFAEVDMRWGLTALMALSLAALLSFRPIRNFSYEAFLMSHMAFIFVFILGIMMHVPDVRVRVYPGFVFWGFDRVTRLARVVFVNFISSPTAPSTAATPKSTIQRLSKDTVRLSVRRSRNLLSSWRPGQHFFVIVPGVSTLPWEAHPFTPASIPHTIDGSSEKDVEINFIIRGRDGFTGRLLRHAIEHESLAETVTSNTILVDGPYGQPPDLGIFDTAILIAGGSGVSYTLSMLLGRIHQARRGKDRTSRVLFVWVIRDASHINWIAPALHAALNAESNVQHPLGIDIRIYVTQGTVEAKSLAKDIKEKNPSDQDITKSDANVKVEPESNNSSTETLVQAIRGGGGSIQIDSGRPDIRKLIDEELAASDGLRVSVDVSGPGLLAGTVRDVLSTSPFATPSGALKGGPSVTLHTETFGW